jgi:hypothetical protein
MTECLAFSAYHKITNLLPHQTVFKSLIIILICITIGIGCSKTQETNKQPPSGNSEQASQLIERLIYSDEKTKTVARNELSSLNDASKSKLVPDLVNTLRQLPVLQYKQASDPNKVVARYRAAETLGILGPIAKDSAPDLINAMKNDNSDLVRQYATASLAKIGLDTDKVVPVLIEALSYSHEATNALSELGLKAVPALIIALKDPRIQSSAALALAKMGPVAKDASPALFEAMKTAKDDKLKKIFSDALKKIGPADADDISTLIQDLKNEDNNIRFKAIDALAVKGKHIAPSVIKLLGDLKIDTRFWAAYVLGRNKADTQETLTTLDGLMKDESNFVRGNAIWAIREINAHSYQLNDIQDDELSAIDHILQMEPKDDDILIQTIYRLENIKKLYPSSTKLDQVYFKSGLAKIAMGSLIGDIGNHSLLAQKYQEQHKEDYVVFLGIMYTGGDFKKLEEKYPNSPLAPRAMLLIAKEKSKVGECESDTDCYIDNAITINLPFLQKYPNHPEVKNLVKEINNEMNRLDQGEELYNINETTPILKDYHTATLAIEDKDIRGEALYPLARAFISVGQYDIAERIYKDLKANYSKYRHIPAETAGHLPRDSEHSSSNTGSSSIVLEQDRALLTATSASSRLEGLNNIGNRNIADQTEDSSLLLSLVKISEKDNSPSVRRRAIDLVGGLASKTSFFRSAVGHCLLYDPDKQNQYYCAMLGIQHPDLKSTEFYTYNQERIRSVIYETTGNTAPIDSMITERRAKMIQEARITAQEANKRAEAEGFNLADYEKDMANRASMQRVSIFGTDYIIIRKKLRLEIVIPLYLLMMLLCGAYCYRIAQRRSADKKFWMILGSLTAPISLFYAFIIPRKNLL